MAGLRNGQQVAVSLLPGVSRLQALTNASGNYLAYGDDSEVVEANPTMMAANPPKTSALLYLFAIILLAVLFHFAVSHERSGMETSFLGIGIYNMIAVGILSVIFIVTIKVAVNKWPIPGLTDLINVV